MPEYIVKQLFKLDDWIFGQLTRLTRWYVAKKKYQKHKYDLLLAVYQWRFLAWIFGLGYPVYQAVLAQEFTIAGISGVWMTMVLGMEVLQVKWLIDIKEDYDHIFANRKHPAIHETWKIKLAQWYEDKRAMRLIALTLSLGLALIALAIAAWYLTIIFLLELYRVYVHFIFDFDEPDQRKKAEDSVTEIVKQAFRNLIGAISPQGIR